MFLDSVASDMTHLFKYDGRGHVVGLNYVAALPHLFDGSLQKFKNLVKENLESAPPGFSKRVSDVTKVV